MNDSKKHALLLSEYSAVQIFYCMGYCCVATYAAVFLQNRGYTNSQLGTIIALGNVGGVLIAPLLASIIDKSRKISIFHCIYFLLFVECIMEILLVFSEGSDIYVAVLYCVLMSCTVALNPLNTELCFSMDRTGQYINFGFSRSCGSLAFSIVTLLLGRICAVYSPELLSTISIVMIIMQFVVLTVIFRVRKIIDSPNANSDMKNKDSSSSLISFLLQNKRFVLFCIGTCVLMFPLCIMGGFLINIVQSLGGTAENMGIISFIAALSEVPAMLFYTRITKNFRCSTILRFAASMFLVRMSMVTLATNLTTLYLSAVTQMLCYALLVPALVDYTSIVVSVNDSAKGQAFSSAMLTMASVLGALVGGILLDKISVRQTMTIGLMVCLIGIAICFLTIDSKKA